MEKNLNITKPCYIANKFCHSLGPSLFGGSIVNPMFVPKILHKLLSSHALGNMQSSQEHLKTIAHAKFGGQTECSMGELTLACNCLFCVPLSDLMVPQ